MVVEVVMNVVLARPSRKLKTYANARPGEIVSKPIATPNPSAAQLTEGDVDALRRAAASAPRSAPTLTTDMSRVKVTSLPPRSQWRRAG